jgi:hypothetical protein
MVIITPQVSTCARGAILELSLCTSFVSNTGSRKIAISFSKFQNSLCKKGMLVEIIYGKAAGLG